MADTKATKVVDPAEESAGKEMRESIVKSQAEYTGNEHSDLVEVKITKDGNYLKKGQTKRVHPTMALILKEKGLIDNLGKPYTRPELKQKDITVDI